jgi:hypothetical protein
MGIGDTGTAPNYVDKCDISMKEMQAPYDKHEKLKGKEPALLLTGVATFPR